MAKQLYVKRDAATDKLTPVDETGAEFGGEYSIAQTNVPGGTPQYAVKFRGVAEWSGGEPGPGPGAEA